MQYGNQASPETQYSHAAILIRIPPFRLRGGNEDAEAKSVYADIQRDERTKSSEDGSEYDSDGNTMYSDSDVEDEPDP